MIRAGDRVELAPAVRLEGTHLVDAVRRTAIPLNESAAVAVRERTPERMARALSRQFAVDDPRAVVDACALCQSLNAALLLNVRVPALVLAARWLTLALVLAPLRRLPRWPAHRRHIATTSAARTLASVARAGAGVAFAVCVAVALPFVLVGLPWVGAVAGAAAAGAVVLHESAHAIALRGAEAALIVRGLRVSVLHPKLEPQRERVVAAAGPSAVAAAAVAVLLTATALDAAPAAPAAVVFALHALGLTVVAPDGRKACAGC